MSSQVIVHKGRTNVMTVKLNINVSGETFTSQIRERPDQNSELIATWTVTVTDVATGVLSLLLDDSVTSTITHSNGFMDIKRFSGGQPLSVFDEPVAVEFRGTVTV
jgi:hypothetical protein